MSTALSLAWGLADIPTPVPLPCLVHVAPRRPYDELSTIISTKATDSISLDLIETEELSSSASASLSLDFPLYGLPRDSFCSWSLTHIEMEQLQVETAATMVTRDPVSEQRATSLTTSSSSSLQPPASSNLDWPASSHSSSNLSAEETRKTEIRAKHYSQSSRLTQQQHRQWWSSKSTTPQSTVNDPLKVAVAAEQRLYKESVKRLVLETCSANFLAMPDLVDTCLESLFSELKQGANRYPPYYTLAGAMERTFQEMRQTVGVSGLPQRLPPVSIIQRRAVLHSVGTTFELPHIPTPFHSITLPRSGDFWLGFNQPRPPVDRASASSSAPSASSSSPASNPSAPSKVSTYLKQVQIPVSHDANAHRLVSTHPEASVVLSASTLCCIANPSVEMAWEVPIRVEEVLDANCNLRKVVFLDKPVLARDMSVKQKNEKFYKMSLKRWLLQNQQGMKMDATSQAHSQISEHSSSHAVAPSIAQGPDNLIYTEWKVGDLKILVRTRVDALSCTSRQAASTVPEASPSSMDVQAPASAASSSQTASKSGTHYIPTAIASKMKHVPENQLEELSTYERTHHLIKTHLLGDDARVLIGHVDPVTARLLSVESLSHQQLKTPNAPSIETCFTQLYDILTWCKTLTPGTFLLSHAPNEHKLTLAELYANKEDVQFKSGIGATCDLHDRQRTAALSNKEMIEYLPPRWDYLRVNQIPNTFPPIGRSCCFDYLRSGKCNHPSSCAHLHINRFEAELRGIATPSHASHNDNSANSTAPTSNDKKKKRKHAQTGTQNQSPKKPRTQ